MSLVLYTNPMSRGRIARWMLEEVGVPYETRYLRYGPEMHSSEYAALNPMRKVPTLVHDGAVITECAAICAYLADAFPEAELAPDPGARHDYYRWMFFAAGPWEAATTNRSLGFEVPADRSGFVGYGDFDRALATLLRAVPQTPYLCGDRFSAADVYVGAQLSWGLQFGSVPARPEVQEYVDRILSRPAQQRAKALDEAAMAEFGPPAPSVG